MIHGIIGWRRYLSSEKVILHLVDSKTPPLGLTNAPCLEFLWEDARQRRSRLLQHCNKKMNCENNVIVVFGKDGGTVCKLEPVPKAIVCIGAAQELDSPLPHAWCVPMMQGPWDHQISYSCKECGVVCQSKLIASGHRLDFFLFGPFRDFPSASARRMDLLHMQW